MLRTVASFGSVRWFRSSIAVSTVVTSQQSETRPQTLLNPKTMPPRDFRLLRNETELLTILDRLGERLTGSHLAAALSRANQLSDAAYHRILPVLTERSLSMAASMSAHDAIFLLAVCSRSRTVDKEIIDALMQRLMHRVCLLQLNGNLMAECLTALAGLQSTIGIPVFDLAQGLARLFVNEGFSERLPTATLVKIITGFGFLRLHSPVVQQTASKEVVRQGRLENMHLDELVRIWMAFGQLQISDSSILRLVSSAISHPDRLKGFNAVELTTLMTASKQLLPFYDRACLMSICEELIKPDRLYHLKEVHLSLVFEAMRDLKIKNDETVEALLEEVTKRNRLPFFTRRSMAAILHALNTLGYGSHVKVQILMERAGRVLDAVNLTDQQLISLILGQRWSESEAVRRKEMLERLSTEEKLPCLSDIVLTALLSVLHQGALSEETRLDNCKQEWMQRLRKGHPQLLGTFAYYLRTYKLDSQDILSVLAEETLRDEQWRQLQPSQLAAITYTLTALGWNQTSVIRQLLTLVSDRLGGISEKGLCQSIAVIQLTRQPPMMPPAFPILKEATEKLRLMQCSEGSLMLIINSFGRMRLQQRIFTQPIFDEVTKLGRLVLLTNQEIADLLYNMAQMRLKGAKAIDNIKQEILKPNRLSKMKSLELCTMVYALGTLRVQEQDLTEAIELKLCHVISASLRNPELSNLIRGLGGLRCRSSVVRSILKEAIHPHRLQAFTGSEFTSVVYGLSFLRGINTELVEAVLMEVQKSQRLTDLTNQHLVHVLVALAHLCPPNGSEEGQSLPGTLLEETIKLDRLCSYTSYQLADIAAILDHPSIQNRPMVMETVASEVVRTERLSSMKSADLTIVSRSLSQARYKDTKILKTISDAVLDRFTKTTKQREI